MKTKEILAGINEKNVVAGWDDAHRYSPAPRHRRRLIERLVADLGFSDFLDAGCAQPFLMQEITKRFHVTGYGCDISDKVMADNQVLLPECQFQALDLSHERWPNEKRFDLVICSEVFEHIPEWEKALTNIVRMSRKHVLITVPSGTMREMDRMVGHYRHFQGPELIRALEQAGCTIVKVRRWGYPLHALYKRLISLISPEKMYNTFAVGRYTLSQRFISEALYYVFFLNDLFNGGDQLIVLAHVEQQGKAAL